MPLSFPLGFRAYDGNHAPKPPFVINKDSQQSHGLIACWPLIDGKRKDLVGLTGADRTLSPAASTATFKPTRHSALGFDGEGGVSDSFNIANPTTGWPISQCSVAAWALFRVLPGSPNSTGWFSLWGGVGSAAISVGEWGGGGFACATHNGSSTAFYQAPTAVFFTNTVHHAVITIDATPELKLYVGGAFWNSTTTTVKVPFTGATLNARVGAGGTNIKPMDGKCWDIRLWNRALSAAEVWDLYNPSTRWDLYHELGQVSYYLPQVGGIPPGMIGHRGSIGGIQINGGMIR